jgi:Tol biopolymer transport system component
MFDFLASPVTKGIQLMRRQQYTEAREYFTRLIENGTSLAESYFNLGKCDFKLEQYDEAREVFHRALDLKPAPEMIRDILEVVNWKMVASYNYVNSWPAFSPDGKLLAYVSARRDTNKDGKIGPDDCGAIYITDLEAGGERIVVPDDFFNTRPVFSPDGKKLAFLSVRARHPVTGIVNQRANAGLYLLDLNSSRETLLLDDTYRTKYHSFTPDGTKIVFSCWRPGDTTSGIYELNLETGTMETLVPGYYENTFPSVSPLGDKLVYSSWQKDTNGDGIIDFHDNSSIIFKQLPGGGGETAVAGPEFNNSFPSFSPDGRQIIYLSVRRDTNRDGKIDALDNPGIYIFDTVKCKEYIVVEDTFFNKFAGFTPDGKRVVFVSNWRRARSGDEEGKDFFENKGIYVTDVSGRNVEQVVSDKYYGSRSPVISPVGDCVAYISWRRGTNRGLYLAYLDRQPTKDELHEWINTNI